LRYRPVGGDPDDGRLGRFIPDDWEHVASYPLTALAAEERPRRVPVVLGVNWYSELGNERADELGAVLFLTSWGRAIRTAPGCPTTCSNG
jgi:hypothetical protein